MAPAPAATDFSEHGSPDGGGYSTLTPIGELLDNPETRAVLVKHLPSLVERAGASEQGRNFSLRAASHFDPRITGELLDLIDRDLAQVTPAR